MVNLRGSDIVEPGTRTNIFYMYRLYELRTMGERELHIILDLKSYFWSNVRATLGLKKNSSEFLTM